MVWALLLLIGVVAAVHWWEYRSDVQEYSFAQPNGLELGGVLREKSPVVLEVGPLPWRPAVAESASWTTADGVSVGEWLKGPRSDGGDSSLAEAMELPTGLSEVDAGRAWWWLPGVRGTEVGILGKEQVRGLEWVDAERRWIGCSHGAGLTVWLVHARYRRYLGEAVGRDPWGLTAAECPWIGRVQFVEVRVRPGWALGVPAHWGFAARPSSAGAEESGGEEAWWWTGDQHSVVSLAVGVARA